jgi:hypothetical protein
MLASIMLKSVTGWVGAGIYEANLKLFRGG